MAGHVVGRMSEQFSIGYLVGCNGLAREAHGQILVRLGVDR